MSYTFFKQHIRVLALVTMCIITPLAFAQQPPQPCHITITGDFESQCILPRDKDSYCNEEEDEVIACQGNKVIYLVGRQANIDCLPQVGVGQHFD